MLKKIPFEKSAEEQLRQEFIKFVSVTVLSPWDYQEAVSEEKCCFSWQGSVYSLKREYGSKRGKWASVSKLD